MAMKLCPDVEDLCGEAQTNIPCPVRECFKILPQPSSLRMHLILVHNVHWSGNKWQPPHGTEVEFHCPAERCIYGLQMERFFRTFSQLKQHYMKVHAEKKLKCDQCCSAFSLPRFLRSHKKTCTGGKSKKNNEDRQSQSLSQNCSDSSSLQQNHQMGQQNEQNSQSQYSSYPNTNSFESSSNVVRPLSDDGSVVTCITHKDTGQAVYNAKSVHFELDNHIASIPLDECCEIVIDDAITRPNPPENMGVTLDQAVSNSQYIPKRKSKSVAKSKYVAKPSKEHDYVELTKAEKSSRNLPEILPKPNVFIIPVDPETSRPMCNRMVMIADTRPMPEPPKTPTPIAPKPNPQTLPPAQCFKNPLPQSKSAANTQTDIYAMRRRKKPQASVAAQTGVYFDGTSTETQTTGDLILEAAMESAQIPTHRRPRQSQGCQVSPNANGYKGTSETQTINTLNIPISNMHLRPNRQSQASQVSPNAQVYKGTSETQTITDVNGLNFGSNRMDFAMNTDEPSRKSQGLQIEMQLHAETQTLQTVQANKLDSSCMSTQTLESFLGRGKIPKSKSTRKRPASKSPKTKKLPRISSSVPNSSTAYYRWVRNQENLYGPEANASTSCSSSQATDIDMTYKPPTSTNAHFGQETKQSPKLVSSSTSTQSSNTDLAFPYKQSAATDMDYSLMAMSSSGTIPMSTSFSDSLATSLANEQCGISSQTSCGMSSQTSSGMSQTSTMALQTDPMFPSSSANFTATSLCTSSSQTMMSAEEADNLLSSFQPISSSGYILGTPSLTDMCTNTDMAYMESMDTGTEVGYVDMQTTTDFDLPTFLDNDTQTSAWHHHHTTSSSQTLNNAPTQHTTATTSTHDLLSDLDSHDWYTHSHTQTSADDFLAGLGLVDIETQTPHLQHSTSTTTATATAAAMTHSSFDPCMNTVETQTHEPTNEISTDSIQTQTLFDTLDLGVDLADSLFGNL